MPDTLHPPFVKGAMTTPRQLWRWLDLNPQGGPLQRIRLFVILPAFDIVSVPWLGYSTIVGECSYRCPNNFSFTSNYTNWPKDPNYTLCVSYVLTDRTVVRYCLWHATGDNLLMDVPIYEGQPILANFKLEIWNTNVDPINATEFRLFTTVFGNLDYRYGQDSSLPTFNNMNINLYLISATGGLTADTTLVTADDISITADIGDDGGWTLPLIWPVLSNPDLNDPL